MWLDILRLFPQVTVMGQGRATGNGGRAKRSATFPGMRNLGSNFISPASRFANSKAQAQAAKAEESHEEILDPGSSRMIQDEEDEDLSLIHI